MFAVIMAGGVGTRFWPKSRAKLPKQLLNIIGKNTLIQSAVARIQPLVPDENIFVVATEQQKDGILKQLPMLKQDNLILEPKGKNTAPCIGLASLYLNRIDPNEIMLVTPADHLIEQEENFLKTVKHAAQLAQKADLLVTIGIKPYYPATGYGYIQYNGRLKDFQDFSAFRVKTFAEKPDLKTAERFVESGDFLWNSGMFLWKVSAILKAIENNMPDLYDSLVEIGRAIGTPREKKVLHKVYCQIKGNSIDYGVMEHAQNVGVLEGDFGWSDVGSWEEVYNISPKDENQNVVRGNHVLRDVRNCLIDSTNNTSSKKIVAAIGVQDLIIVDTGDALLICRRDLAQDVKDVVEIMKRKNMVEFL